MNESSVSRSEVRSGATDGSRRPRTQSANPEICIAQASAMLIPSIFDERAPAFSRVPWRSGHGANVIARSTKARTCGCIASRSFERNDFWIDGISPAYVRLMPSTSILVAPCAGGPRARRQ